MRVGRSAGFFFEATLPSHMSMAKASEILQKRAIMAAIRLLDESPRTREVSTLLLSMYKFTELRDSSSRFIQIKAKGASISKPKIWFLALKRFSQKVGTRETAKEIALGGEEHPLKSRAAMRKVDVAASVYKTKSGLRSPVLGIRGERFEITTAHQCRVSLS